MNDITDPTVLEKLSGSLITQSLLTTLSVSVGSPLAALLPVLSNSLANSRHKKRVEKALLEIIQKLEEHEVKIRNLTDAQYKIINEIILLIFQTVEEEKIKYLKEAINFNIEKENISMSLAYTISRILRDISVEEITFLIKNKNYKKIILVEGGESSNKDILDIDPLSEQGILFSGLVAMGLMIPGVPIMGTQGNYKFSPIANKILEVIGI